jgi:uncharacterized DUF497 family protein
VLSFKWDPSKNTLNRKKHKVTFEEAKGVFYDSQALLISDPEHSDNEDRFVLMGLSFDLRLLVVCHCYRESDEVIRIISARKAKPYEVRQYQEKL